MPSNLLITNSRIISFYEKHPQINFNSVNLLLVELLENSMNFSKTNDKTPITLNEIQNIMTTTIIASENRISSNRELTEKSTKDSVNKIQTIDAAKPAPKNQINIILNKLYNSAEIGVVESNQTDGIYSLKRLRKQNVLIKSTFSEENVGIEEVESFTQMVNEKNCSGVLLSQTSGISTKKDFQIEIHNNNNIVVYIHNSNYSTSHIESAISIIDNLYAKLRQYAVSTNDGEFSIPKDILELINSEYYLFMTQKNAVIELFKDNQKKVISQMDELRFPCLEKFLVGKFTAPIQKAGLKCDLCKGFNANNLKALAAHKRGCIRKNCKNTITSVTVVAPVNLSSMIETC
jgi:hypothetical protein